MAPAGWAAIPTNFRSAISNRVRVNDTFTGTFLKEYLFNEFSNVAQVDRFSPVVL